MDAVISPSRANGAVRAISSKSDAHRLLICAALADCETEIEVPDVSEDIEATARCLCSLGAKIRRDNGIYSVAPIAAESSGAPALDCAESGSTLRFLLPVAASLYKAVSFDGHGRLPSRPLSELISEMEKHGVAFSSRSLPFTISGIMTGGDFYLPGNVSSQYITGLIFALPIVSGGAIHLTTPLESAPYVDMTLHCVKRFGCDARKTRDGWSVPAQKFRSPGKLRADGDWSNASFFLAAGAISGSVTVTGLDTASPQGDKEILTILRDMGADIEVHDNSVTASKGSLRCISADLKNIPDLLPILAVLASFADGESEFYGASRLAMKESDRLRAVSDMIISLGGSCKRNPDGIIVEGRPLTGGTAASHGDHRIAMAASIGLMCSSRGGTVTGAEAVRKSYPDYYSDLMKIGGQNVITIR